MNKNIVAILVMIFLVAGEGVGGVGEGLLLPADDKRLVTHFLQSLIGQKTVYKSEHLERVSNPFLFSALHFFLDTKVRVGTISTTIQSRFSPARPSMVLSGLTD